MKSELNFKYLCGKKFAEKVCINLLHRSKKLLVHILKYLSSLSTLTFTQLYTNLKIIEKKLES